MALTKIKNPREDSPQPCELLRAYFQLRFDSCFQPCFVSSMNDAMARCQNMVELHPENELALNRGQVGSLAQAEERLRQLEAHPA